MNLLINIEISAREMLGNSLLAARAAKRGWKTLLADHWWVQQLVPHYSQYLNAFIDGASTPNERKVSKFGSMKNLGIFVYSLDHEAGLKNEIESFVKTRYGKNTAELCSGLFFWGSRDADAFTSFLPALKDKAHNTGTPRLDVWRLAKNHVKCVHGDVRNPQILFSSNCVVNSRRFYWERLRSLVDGGYLEGTAAGLSQRIHRIAAVTERIGCFLRLMESIKQRLPGVEIVVRPHPEEDPEAWGTLSNLTGLFSLSDRFSLIEDVVNSSVVVHSGCTAGIEACMAGVPSIDLCKLETLGTEKDYGVQVGWMPESLEEAVLLIKKAVGGSAVPAPHRSDFLNEFFPHEDQKFSCDKILDIIEGDVSGRRNTQYALPLKLWKGKTLYHANSIKKSFRSRERFKESMRKTRGLDAETVKRFISWCFPDGSHDDVKVSQVAKNLVVVG